MHSSKGQGICTRPREKQCSEGVHKIRRCIQLCWNCAKMGPADWYLLVPRDAAARRCSSQDGTNAPVPNSIRTLSTLPWQIVFRLRGTWYARLRRNISGNWKTHLRFSGPFTCPFRRFIFCSCKHLNKELSTEFVVGLFWSTAKRFDPSLIRTRHVQSRCTKFYVPVYLFYSNTKTYNHFQQLIYNRQKF